MKRIIAVLAATIILSFSGCLAAFGLFEQDDRTAKSGVTDIAVTQPTENQNDENTYINTDKQTPLKDVSLPDIPEQDITLPNIPELEQNPEQDNKTEIEIPRPTNAETKEDEDNIEKSLLFRLNDDGTAYGVKVVDRHITEIVIPQFYNGLPVTEILDNGFGNSNELEKVTFSGIKRIGRNAFINCRVLSEITDLSTVKIIGDSAFLNCLNLDRIILPSSLVELGEQLFLNCSTTVFIRKTEEEMNELNPHWSDGRDKTARTVYIGADIPSGNEAALDKTMQFESIHNGTEYRVNYRFSLEPINVTELNIPLTYNGKPVTEIGYLAINKNLVNVSIPDSVLEISPHAFMNCEKLEAVIGMHNVKRIMDYAFYNCVKLNRIEIPSIVEYIGAKAFWFNKIEGNLEFSSSLKYIGDEAFMCSKISGVTFKGSMEYLGVSAFDSCYRIKRVILPQSLKRIENRAFIYCGGIEELTLPLDVEYIGELAFRQAQELKKIVFPTSLEYIGNYAFACCYKLERIVLPSKLKYLGDRAFYDCKSLKEFIMSPNLEYIGEYFFTNKHIKINPS